MLFGDTVKVADFGLSAQMSGPRIARRACGTPEYCAPEVFHSLLSRHSDQFSLAVTYCELRGGRLPYPQPPRTFQTTYVHPRPDLSMLSPEERPILTRALASSPEERWPSCVEFIDRVSRLFV
jgi:serine/threonine protein kinase